MKNILLKTFPIIVVGIFLVALAGCARSDGGTGTTTNTGQTEQDQLDELKRQIRDLQALTSGLGDLVTSEYASCSNSGDLTNNLIRKICVIAQGATAELQTQLLSQLGILQINMQAEIDVMQQTLSNESLSLGQRIDYVSSLVGGFDDRITALEGRMTSAENAIDAINAFNDATDLPGAMKVILVGADNITSGPVFESVVKRRDKTQFVAFVQTWDDTVVNIESNGLARTASSTAIVVTATGHGLSDGDIIKIAGVSLTSSTGIISTVEVNYGGNGYAVGDILTVGGGGSGGKVEVKSISGGGGTGPVTSVDVYSKGSGYVVGNGYSTSYAGSGSGCKINVTAVENNNLMSSDFNGKLFTVNNKTEDTFEIYIKRPASNTDPAFGGGSMTALKLLGRQMQEIWGAAVGNESDTEVRTTSLGTVPYNYIIKRITSTTGALCYDKTNPNADFTTIDTNSPNGGENIVCK